MSEGRKIDVLDQGYVILHEWMPKRFETPDLGPVNAAKASFDQKADRMTAREERLLKFLAGGRPTHWSPYAHGVLQFEFAAPLMVVRQLNKHRIGFRETEDEYSDFEVSVIWDSIEAHNESSRRYVKDELSFYVPAPDRWQAAPPKGKNKQGSDGYVDSDTGVALTNALLQTIETSTAVYEEALAAGVAPQQARLFLPAYGLYLKVYWTVTLYGLIRMLQHRTELDTQEETRYYAEAFRTLAYDAFPRSLEHYGFGPKEDASVSHATKV